MAVHYVNSPLGPLRLTGTDDALTGIQAVDESGENESPELLSRTARELTEYFALTRREFTVALTPEGTEFQRAVWKTLCAIPYGKTMTYAQVAAAVGRPKAARAVGNAVGANPCLILIPCHRVTAKHGLGGFSCGVWRKELLLHLEGSL